MSSEYKFDEPENTACVVCDHMMAQQRPILFASHGSEDGYWQFLCGHDHTSASIRFISLKQATIIDQSINDLYEMPMGIAAKRESIHDAWQPFRLPE
jgi:hypothetical protein